MSYSSFGHRFISGDVVESFNGDVFLEELSKHCLTCGALYVAVRLNYEGDWTLMSNVADEIQVCSGDTDSHNPDGDVLEGCPCLICKP